MFESNFKDICPHICVKPAQALGESRPPMSGGFWKPSSNKDLELEQILRKIQALLVKYNWHISCIGFQISENSFLWKLTKFANINCSQPSADASADVSGDRTSE